MSDSDACLLDLWYKRQGEIESRLEEFKHIREGGERALFQELCFCLLTPQSSAAAADRAMRHLLRTGLLYSGGDQQVAAIISGSGILYGDNKGRYLVEARKKLLDERTVSFEDLLVDDPLEARERVVENIKGLGYKEASHFLRNIGYEGLAILDRHVMRTLCEAEVIDCFPKAISRKAYLETEGKFLEYSRKLGIPPDALDMVMWSAKTGRVFK